MADLNLLAARARALGYALQAFLPVAALGEPVSKPAPGLDTVWIVCNVGDTVQRRWLAGRPVTELLRANREAGPESAGPLDEFCKAELVSLLGERAHQVLFPHRRAGPRFPLIAVLETAGLLRPSPIMSSLHARYGSWWAVRGVIALQGGAAAMPPPASLGASPCLGCDAPCVGACPGRAVSRDRWDFEACASQRVRPGSPCAQRCPARLACPAGSGFRYGEAVLTYHYEVSLQTLREAAASSKRPSPPTDPDRR